MRGRGIQHLYVAHVKGSALTYCVERSSKKAQ